MQPLIFFGTPEFAVPTLEALVGAGRRPLRVVTQPPRPAGRGRKLEEPPVARWAHEHELEVAQPRRVRDPEFVAELARIEPAVAVVVAFGQIFSAELLAIPRHGFLNLHASLLPQFRGAAPVQAAILAGETETGVTTMQIEEKLDSGPILLQEETAIGPEETAGELSERLARLGAALMVQTLELLEAGKLEPQKQQHDEASLAPRLTKADGKIDWQRSAGEVFNRLRAMTPWPGAFTQLRENPLKILWGRPVSAESETAIEPGKLIGLNDDRLVVACGKNSSFGIERLQRPGKKILTAREFQNGERLKSGERFG